MHGVTHQDKVVPLHDVKVYRRKHVKLQLLTSASDGDEWSALGPGRLILLQTVSSSP